MEAAAEKPVSKAALAEWLGVSPPALDKHIAAGRFPRVGNRYDLRASVRAYCEHLRETASGRGGEESVADLTKERARLAHVQANLAEVKLAMQRGELVRAEDVERTWADHIRRTRSAVLAVPSRIRQLLGHIGDMETRVIDRELRDALTALGEADEDAEAA